MNGKAYRVLIVGVGSIGERHLRCFLQTGRCRVSICELNAGLREQIARRYDIAASYDEPEAAMAEQHDAAVIATPAHRHIALAQLAVDAGMHVLIEKPLAVSADEAGEFLTSANRRELVAAVGYVQRAHPALAAMREAVCTGRFGRPLALTAVSGQHFPTCRPGYQQTYYGQRATGGGAIHDAITHTLDAGQWLLGPIDRLVADADHLSLSTADVEDIVHVLARHGNALATYSLNQFQAPNEKTITVVCERGTARFEYHLNRWKWMTAPSGQWHEEPAERIERDALFMHQANRFLDAIEHGERPLCTLEEGFQALQVNLAAIQSVEKRSWIDLFFGNPQGASTVRRQSQEIA